MNKCLYQIDTPISGTYYCLNSKVHITDNIVTDKICDNCVFAKDEVVLYKLRKLPEVPQEKIQSIYDRHHHNIKEPNILQKSVNFGSAMFAHIKAGMPIVSDEVQQRRIKICEGCPLFNPDHRTCKVCGCAMDIKVAWSEQRCPDNPPKWEAETT